MKSIDHYVLMVHDLERARQAYLKLGFNVRPAARHIEFGSSNAVVILADTYLELIDLGQAIPLLRDQYIDRFECGPGLAHVSLTAGSLADERTRLEAFGYMPGPEGNARRRVILPDGSEDETDSSFLYNWKTPHRFLSLFFSEHRKPDAIFIKGHTDHGNGVTRLAGITCLSDDPSRDIGYYEQSYGHAAEPLGGGFLMRGGRGDRMAVLDRGSVLDQFGGALGDLDTGRLGGFPVALHYAVADRNETRAYLDAAGVPLVDCKAGLTVPARAAEGCAIVFE